MTHFDVVVIGAGSGNTIIDRRFHDLRVAIIEEGPFGGTCLNRGCIPSKMFVHPADVVQHALHGPEFGVHTSVDGVDWPAIRDRVFARVDPIAADGLSYREKQEHVTVLTGSARFTGERALEVALTDGETVGVTADQIVLAAGSRPEEPPIKGLAEVGFQTSDTIMRLDSLPKRLGIIGGGYVGCELAHVFSSYGVEVTVVQRVPVLLAGEDTEIAERFTAEVIQRWDVRLETNVDGVEASDGGKRLILDDGSSVEVDEILLATGRVPNSDRLDLERAGVEVDESGLVVVDDQQRTTAEGVWALGDISTHYPLKHVANAEARVVSHNLLDPDDLWSSDHRAVPHAVFTSPQVAGVGLTERAAREQGIDLAIATHEYAAIAHGWAMEEQEGGHFAKLLADRATGRLVGAHLIGPEASNLIQPLIQAMSFDQPVAGLARGQYWIHPALTELVENALVSLEEELG